MEMIFNPSLGRHVNSFELTFEGSGRGGLSHHQQLPQKPYFVGFISMIWVTTGQSLVWKGVDKGFKGRAPKIPIFWPKMHFFGKKDVWAKNSAEIRANMLYKKPNCIYIHGIYPKNDAEQFFTLIWLFFGVGPIAPKRRQLERVDVKVRGVFSQKRNENGVRKEQ